MQYQTIGINEFLLKAEKGVVLDVRSPKEYKQAHLPEAVSFPIFNDDERHEIGLTYKRKNQQKAIRLGLEMVGPKLASFVDEAEKIAQKKPLFIYCWRGGMRSNSMAMLLATAGFTCYVLKGGYKSYRRWALKNFEDDYNLINIGGYTGSAKTELLHELQKAGEQVIDLEGLAGHYGSAFGNLSNTPQPTTEQFENTLAFELNKLNKSQPIYIEDESRAIGLVGVPLALFNAMQQAPLFIIEKTRQERVEHLKQLYGNANKAETIAAFNRIKKRLGNQMLQTAVDAVAKNNAEKAIEIGLNYYDGYYYKSLHKRNFNRLIRIKQTKHLLEMLEEIKEKTKLCYAS